MLRFALQRLTVVSHAYGFTLWHYNQRAGFLRDVLKNHYFSPAHDMMAAGDMILVSASDGGSMLFVSECKEASGVVVRPMKSTDEEQKIDIGGVGQ